MNNTKSRKGLYYDEYNDTLRSRAELVGYFLGRLRKISGITQKEIAEKVGIAHQTYQGYESGKHEPSIEIIIRIADIYGVTLDFITGRFIQLGNFEVEEEMMIKVLEELPLIKAQLELERTRNEVRRKELLEFIINNRH